MTELERFMAVARFERPDYVPIFGFPGAPGMSQGVLASTHDRLVAMGMPAHVGGRWHLRDGCPDIDSWCRYWGTTRPATIDFTLALGVRGFAETRTIEGEFEFIESESGARTRRILDNDIRYGMPEFIAYPVRDRASWDFYRERMTPARVMPQAELDERARKYDRRERPLVVGVGGIYGFLRGLLGPEKLSLTFYDDPELIHDMAAWKLNQFRTYSAPLIARLRPEVVQMGEDLCYNHGMLLSPKHFHQFCGDYYRAVAACARASGSELLAIDTDGNAMEFVAIAESYGVNAMFPFEVKAGNDLFVLRRRHPRFVFLGWLEKECANEGNEGLIETEILSKVPPLLERGGYFPNGDHGIQPLVTFRNLCKFMTVLHEVTGNPEGEFPRMRP